MDRGVIAFKEYSTFRIASEVEYHRLKFSIIIRTLIGGGLTGLHLIYIYIYTYIYIYICIYIYDLVYLFNGILTFVGCLMPKGYSTFPIDPGLERYHLIV